MGVDKKMRLGGGDDSLQQNYSSCLLHSERADVRSTTRVGREAPSVFHQSWAFPCSYLQTCIKLHFKIILLK